MARARRDGLIFEVNDIWRTGGAGRGLRRGFERTGLPLRREYVFLTLNNSSERVTAGGRKGKRIAWRYDGNGDLGGGENMRSRQGVYAYKCGSGSYGTGRK